MPAQGYKSIEIVQAYIIDVLWGCGPVQRYEQDQTWMLLGMAIRCVCVFFVWLYLAVSGFVFAPVSVLALVSQCVCMGLTLYPALRRFSVPDWAPDAICVVF